MIVGEIIGLVTGLVGCLGSTIGATAWLCNPFGKSYHHRKENLRTLKKQMKELEQLTENVKERLEGDEIFGCSIYKWFEKAQYLPRKMENCHFEDKVDQRCPGRCLPNLCTRFSKGKQILEMISEVDDLLQELDKPSVPSSPRAETSFRLLTDVRGRIRHSRQLKVDLLLEKVETIWNYLKKENNVNIIGVLGVGGVGKTNIVTEIHNRALKEKKPQISNIAPQICNSGQNGSPEQKREHNSDIASQINNLGHSQAPEEKKAEQDSDIAPQINNLGHNQAPEENKREHDSDMVLPVDVFDIAPQIDETDIAPQISNLGHHRASKKKRGHGSNRVPPINNLNKCFDYVFWVDVSRKSNTIQSMQRSIAAAVNIKLPNNAIEAAAALSNALMKKGSYLLILDDMMTDFSLEEVGIPQPTTENGCKIIITSRSAIVCKNMKADKIVQVERLSTNDAQALIINEIGAPRAKTIASLTKGSIPAMPIMTLARVIRNGKEHDRGNWDLEVIGKPLKFIYETLSGKQRDDRIQSCFFYCALYPKGFPINPKELIECWMWEGFLGDDEEMIEVKMQRGQMVMQKLKAGKLLGFNRKAGEEVTMDDLIRHIVIGITPRFLIRAGVGKIPNEWPRDVEKVSLIKNDFKRFDPKPRCPQLVTLLLQHNSSLTFNFYDDFFTEMPLLRVLNLSYTGIVSLPNISELKNLRTLLLSSCRKLNDLPSLVGLVLLTVLDFSYTGVTQLPDGLEGLTNLRRLDLSYTKVKNFQSGLLSAFKHLEELLMYGCDFFWGPTRIGELKDSQNLVVLEVNFRNEHAFDAYIKSDHCYQLKSFKFCVSEIYSGTMGNYGISITENFHVNGFPVLLPDQTTDLHMSWCEDITQLQIRRRFKNLKVVDINDSANLKILFKSTMMRRLPNLQHIAIKQCQSLEKVIEDEEISNDTGIVSVPHIQTLTLVNLPKLESIYNGKVEWDSLQTIEVLKCKNLKMIPSPPDGLETIRGEEAWFKSLDPNSQTLLQPRFETPEQQLSRKTASKRSSSSSETAGLTMKTGVAMKNIEEPSSTKGKEIVEDTGDNSGTITREAGGSSSGSARVEPSERNGHEAIATSHNNGNNGIATTEPRDDGTVTLESGCRE